MNRSRTTTVSLVAVASLAAGLAAARRPARAQERADWAPVEQVLGKGELSDDGTFKITLPRKDVTVKTATGMPVPAALGLSSYAAFVGKPTSAVVVGDTCLLPQEVNPVIDELREDEIEVVAVHNHMLGDEPRIVFLHFQGKGNATALAKALRRAWDLLGTIHAPEAPAKLAGAKEPSWTAIAGILGRAGPAPKDGVYKVTLPRKDLALELDGEALHPAAGLACWAAFYACPCGRTMVMGDTCVTRSELQHAIDALRKHGIAITGLHNHLLGSSSDVMFLHIEGEGDALELAKGVRAAWDVLGK